MTRTRVDRWSTPLARLDAPANAVTDGMNRAVPWLWWPLRVPARDTPLSAGAHALYALHGVVLHALAGRHVMRRRSSALAVGVVSWLWFSGAWDRRAARERR